VRIAGRSGDPEAAERAEQAFLVEYPRETEVRFQLANPSSSRDGVKIG